MTTSPCASRSDHGVLMTCGAFAAAAVRMPPTLWSSDTLSDRRNGEGYRRAWTIVQCCPEAPRWRSMIERLTARPIPFRPASSCRRCRTACPPSEDRSRAVSCTLRRRRCPSSRSVRMSNCRGHRRRRSSRLTRFEAGSVHLLQLHRSPLTVGRSSASSVRKILISLKLTQRQRNQPLA